MTQTSTDTPRPTVSAVMGLYNEADRLDESIRSVLEQTFEDLELIAVDDGSTDRTAAMLESWAVKDTRVRLVRNGKNLGLPRTLNAGIEASRGVWIARIDAGDSWEPGKLQAQLDYVETHPEVGLIGTWTENENHATGARVVSEKPVEDEEIKRAVWKCTPFVHSTILVRKSLLERFGAYNLEFACAQDYDLYFRLVFSTVTHNIPRPLCHIPTHQPGSISLVKWREQQRNGLIIRWRNYRLHRLPWYRYFGLLPMAARLCLPSGTKRWGQALRKFLAGPRGRP